MLLSLLSKKEKLKFFDLAIHIASIGGEPGAQEHRMLKIFAAEMFDVSDSLIAEYDFNKSSNLEDTIDFFNESNITVRKISYLNLFKISLISPVYTNKAHFLLERIRETFSISESQKRVLVNIVYTERDLRDKALRIVGFENNK